MKTRNRSLVLSLPAVMTFILAVLKLIGVIDLSWFWVLSPLWISLALSMVGLLVFGVVAFILAFAIVINKRKNFYGRIYQE